MRGEQGDGSTAYLFDGLLPVDVALFRHDAAVNASDLHKACEIFGSEPAARAAGQSPALGSAWTGGASGYWMLWQLFKHMHELLWYGVRAELLPLLKPGLPSMTNAYAVLLYKAGFRNAHGLRSTRWEKIFAALRKSRHGYSQRSLRRASKQLLDEARSYVARCQLEEQPDSDGFPPPAQSATRGRPGGPSAGRATGRRGSKPKSGKRWRSPTAVATASSVRPRAHPAKPDEEGRHAAAGGPTVAGRLSSSLPPTTLPSGGPAPCSVPFVARGSLSRQQAGADAGAEGAPPRGGEYEPVVGPVFLRPRLPGRPAAQAEAGMATGAAGAAAGVSTTLSRAARGAEAATEEMQPEGALQVAACGAGEVATSAADSAACRASNEELARMAIEGILPPAKKRRVSFSEADLLDRRGEAPGPPRGGGRQPRLGTSPALARSRAAGPRAPPGRAKRSGGSASVRHTLAPISDTQNTVIPSVMSSTTMCNARGSS